MDLNLAISTCPNDTFMFDALINNKIDTFGHNFNVVLKDIEQLNQMAYQGVNDITKISFNAFAHKTKQYQMLRSGVAIGFGNGPLVISKRKIYPDELSDAKIAIPGKTTTANLLLSILFPEVINKSEYLFSDIEEAILSNEVDAGVIIHETRFSYHKKGLLKIVDLGGMWEDKFNLPLPLGGIAIKRDLPIEIKRNIEELISNSVTFAFSNPDDSMKFVKSYARELDEDTIKKHIELYVNDYSVNCKNDGEKAISIIANKVAGINKIELTNPIFV